MSTLLASFDSLPPQDGQVWVKVVNCVSPFLCKLAMVKLIPAKMFLVVDNMAKLWLEIIDDIGVGCVIANSQETNQ